MDSNEELIKEARTLAARKIEDSGDGEAVQIMLGLVSDQLERADALIAEMTAHETHSRGSILTKQDDEPPLFTDPKLQALFDAAEPEGPVHDPVPSEEEVERRLAAADGVLGAAGHEVTDPEIREIVRRKIRGEIAGDEAERLILAYLGVDPYLWRKRRP